MKITTWTIQMPRTIKKSITHNIAQWKQAPPLVHAEHILVGDGLAKHGLVGRHCLVGQSIVGHGLVWGHGLVGHGLSGHGHVWAFLG